MRGGRNGEGINMCAGGAILTILLDGRSEGTGEEWAS